jgi:cardiolipin synthase
MIAGRAGGLRDVPALPVAADDQDGVDARLTRGNRIRVLRDGAQTLPAMFAAIRGAMHFVYLDYYVLEELHCSGTTLSRLLADAGAKGVRVAIIFDALGSEATPEAFFSSLAAAGAQLLRFNPVNPLGARHRWRPNTIAWLSWEGST